MQWLSLWGRRVGLGLFTEGDFPELRAGQTLCRLSEGCISAFLQIPHSLSGIGPHSLYPSCGLGSRGGSLGSEP